MHGWEIRMLLKHYLEQGVTKAELSRRFGVNPRTIYSWIKTGQLDRDLSAGARVYASRAPVAHKPDPYKGIIDARLEAFPKLSAKRLFDEVRAAGYPGGYECVRDYVSTVRPREPVEAAVRFETPAGHQGQVDFGTFTLPWGRRHALMIVLGYSRLLWLRFYPRQTMPVLMEALESAFYRFGGVPEELLFDQMRTVVLSDDRAGGGALVLNAQFLRFASDSGLSSHVRGNPPIVRYGIGEGRSIPARAGNRRQHECFPIPRSPHRRTCKKPRMQIVGASVFLEARDTAPASARWY